MPPSNPSLLLLLLSSISVVGTAQPSQQDSQDAATSFRPGIAVVTGIFSVVFSLTFLLLLYAKFCHASSGDLFSTSDAADGHISSAHSRFSGIDRMAIESLPVFLFSSLRGARAGLECAVCLSRFDDADILRLLPKCKHAFHLDCVDRWLQAHSSCPLCRCRVSAEDATLFKYSTSSRFLFPSLRREDAGKDAELELFVAREPRDSDRRGSSRFSIGGSFRRTKEKEKEKERSSLLVMEEGSGGAGECYHRFKHWIVISDVVFKRRWSDINSSDLISLNTDLLIMCSSKRFPGLDSNLNPSVDKSEIKIEEEMGSRGQSAAVDPASYGGAISGRTGSRALISSSGNNRSMSEITNLSRFRAVGDPGGAEEEKARRLWLPIARRTVQWFAGRENKGVVTSV